MKLIQLALFSTVAATFVTSASAAGVDCQSAPALPSFFEALFTQQWPKGEAAPDDGFYVTARSNLSTAKLVPSHMLARFSAAGAAVAKFDALVANAEGARGKLAIDQAWTNYPGQNGPRKISIKSYQFCVPGHLEPMQVTISNSLEDSGSAADRRFFVGVQLL